MGRTEKAGRAVLESKLRVDGRGLKRPIAHVIALERLAPSPVDKGTCLVPSPISNPRRQVAPVGRNLTYGRPTRWEA